jgi:hypothetical protein
MSKLDRQIEHTEKRLADVKAIQRTLLAIERELDEYHEVLSLKLASLERAGPVLTTVSDLGVGPSLAVTELDPNVPVPPPPPLIKSAPMYYYVSRLSPRTGKSQPTEIDENDFPSELRNQRPDQDDTLYTKMPGYAMERVWGRFQREILDGWMVYSIISEDWRLISWLKAPCTAR